MGQHLSTARELDNGVGEDLSVNVGNFCKTHNYQVEKKIKIIIILHTNVTAVECPQIAAPRHGSRDGDRNKYPAKVTFVCFPGYEMQGVAETSCQANGQWSNDVPTCTGTIIEL